MIFRFKQFEVVQEKSAMKIGTDAVLLGAWAPFVSTCKNILDIGTGTGLLALMMAQRFPQAKIKAIDIDLAATKESKFNFEQSPWAKRLYSEHISLDTFCQYASQKFDAILCNPPFYRDGFAPSESARSKARDNAHLRLEDLFSAVSHLLSTQGEFALLVPFSEKEYALNLAKTQNLFPRKLMLVKGKPHLSNKRVYILFDHNPTPIKEEESLVLEWTQHERTPEYQALVASFYL